jgi:GNAT superfamily N-acetyltransferase
MTEQKVGVAAPSDREKAIATLEFAFAADPVMRWLWPDPIVYRSTFSGFVAAIADRAFDQGTSTWLDDGRAVALWLPPGFAIDDDALTQVMLESVSPDLLEDLMSFGTSMTEYHPIVEHWYLPITGVDPYFQGKGLGTTLLRHTLATCDLQDLPAYLEASTSRNRQLYERLGFKATGVIQVGTSPEVWPMLREPNPPR